MRSDSRTGLQIIAPHPSQSENYLGGIPVRNSGVKIASPMKARNPLLLVFAATLALWGPVAERIVAAQTPDPQPTPPAPAAAPASATPAPSVSAPAASAPRHVSQLSKKEAEARFQALPAEERQWLDYVAPIIYPDERNLFLQLEAHQYETFKKDFWARRE